LEPPDDVAVPEEITQKIDELMQHETVQVSQTTGATAGPG
jgi:hypothetical protein